MAACTLSIKVMTQLILSSAIILGCLIVAKVVMHITQGSFPAPLLGMLLLLGLLLTGIIKERSVTPCASPLLNYMPLFFIPAGVGFIEHLNLISLHWQFILACLVLIPLTSLLLISHLIISFKGRSHHD